jgi:aminoglycoside phosphotransferase (APT) family kinase protein
LYWQARLEPLGLPLPRLYHNGEIESYPFAVYQRLSGVDLEAIYPGLSPETRRRIARCVTEIQQRIHILDDGRLRAALPWPDMVQHILKRSELEIGWQGCCDLSYVDRLRQTLARYEAYLAAISPVAFLYDAGVRNVIVYQEKVSGVIDVDEVWYGDPLLAIGRGKTLLLLMEQETDYITYWAEWLNLSEFQLKVIDLYALLYCVRFMGTLGQRLNGNKSVQTDPTKAERLEELAQDYLDVV